MKTTNFKNSVPVNDGKVHGPIAFDENSPPFVFPVEVMGRSQISAMHAACGTLALGAPGGGKTISAIFPIAASIMAYKNEDSKRAGLVYIDPKGEAEPFLRKRLRLQGEEERLTVIRESKKRFWLFEFFQEMTIPDRIEYLESMFMPDAKRGADSYSWFRKSLRIINNLAVIEANSDVYSKPECNGSWLGSVLELAMKGQSDSASYGSMSFFEATREVFNLYQVQSPDSGFHRAIYELTKRAIEKLKLAGSYNPFPSDYKSERITQWGYFQDQACELLNKLTDPYLTSFIDCEPFRKSTSVHHSFASLLNAGQVVLFNPSPCAGNSDQLIGGVVRSLLAGYLRKREDPKMVTGYICDEFHNYFSTDPKTGESAILSWARGYRFVCCMATQSIEALYARAAEQIGFAGGEAAVNSMLTNLANRLTFKSNQPETQSWAERMYGSNEGLLGLNRVRCRPLSSLQPGEYYYRTAQGVSGLQAAMPIDTAMNFEKFGSVNHETKQQSICREPISVIGF